MWFPPYFYFRFGRRRWSRVVYRRLLSTFTSNGQPCVTYGTTLLSVLSVMLVYCGQTLGWIRMPRGTQVGLGPGDIVLDPPTCWVMSIVAKRSPMSELLTNYDVQFGVSCVRISVLNHYAICQCIKWVNHTRDSWMILGLLSEYWGANVVNIWRNLDKIARCIQHLFLGIWAQKQVWNFKMKTMLSLLFVTYCMCLLTCLC